MPSESGDMKLLGNFRQLIDQVSADTSYNPANVVLAKTALETQYAAARAAAEAVLNTLAPNKLAINERLTAFEAMEPLVLRSRNMLKAAGVSKETLEDAETSVRKILGRRKTSKTPPPPPGPDGAQTTEAAAVATHSSSQMSFDNRLGNLSAYIAILDKVAAYNPNEADLKVTALKAMAADLQAKNDAVSSTFVPLSQARGIRDDLLYTGANCVVNVALLVKAYVKAALGTSSQLNKQIKGLQFKRSPK
jgi:hypothetical protein